MRRTLLVCVLALVCGTAWGQTVYPNLDESTTVDPGGGTYGWGSCTTCAGGQNEDLAVIFTAPNQSTPSIDGRSREFNISGPAYANGLWWYKLGPNDSATRFQFDFWLYVDSSSSAAQAFEFDVFQFVGTQRYTFGTQCNYASGFWDVWNQGAGTWSSTRIACERFQPSRWYHITETFHRTSDLQQHYDSLTIVQYNRNRPVSRTYNFNRTYPSAPLPLGWTENLGVQFQIDIGPTGTQISEWVDGVTLTVR